MPTWDWTAQNIDQIGPYVLMIIATWAFMIGLNTARDRLADWQELVKVMREENRQLRTAVSDSNDALEAMVRHMESVNHVLERIAEEEEAPPRSGRQS